jgi:hypothetical protein
MNMKTKTISGFAALVLCVALSATAQSIQYVTLTDFMNFPVQTNQIISVVGYDWGDVNGRPQVQGTLLNGTVINLNPYGLNPQNSSLTTQSAQIPQIATGMINISVGNSPFPYAWATFKIETPCTANVISNYVPADAIVIPASVTGNVQIILESSPDLVNWTAASPGTYGAAAGTNRFFRVRATVSP